MAGPRIRRRGGAEAEADPEAGGETWARNRRRPRGGGSGGGGGGWSAPASVPPVLLPLLLILLLGGGGMLLTLLLGGGGGGGGGGGRVGPTESSSSASASSASASSPVDSSTATAADRAHLAAALEHRLAPLRPIDRESYTVRINTWRRNEQLLASLDHHSACPGVAQIQVVWCDPDREPPPEVVGHPSGLVTVELHSANTLNERFRVGAGGTPTLGILSMDDDVLRPCAALDAGFFRWTRNPDRLVGYDARLHLPEPAGEEDGRGTTWSYGYKSSTELHNRYSLTLPRYCFVHRDYLDLYISHLPRSMLGRVADTFECEDIALSLFVTALTGGRPPLLADFWAARTQVKLYSPATISGSKGHKATRDGCVQDFLGELGLRDGSRITGMTGTMGTHVLWHEAGIMFEWGAEPDPGLWEEEEEEEKEGGGGMPLLPRRHAALAARVREWKRMAAALPAAEAKREVVARFVEPMMEEARRGARAKGLVDKTPEWRERWNKTKAAG